MVTVCQPSGIVGDDDFGSSYPVTGSEPAVTRIWAGAVVNVSNVLRNLVWPGDQVFSSEDFSQRFKPTHNHASNSQDCPLNQRFLVLHSDQQQTWRCPTSRVPVHTAELVGVVRKHLIDRYTLTPVVPRCGRWRRAPTAVRTC